MYFENSRAHGTLCTLCQSSDLSDLSDLSDILCPQYRHCAMRSASRWECALFSGERHAHGAGVRHLAGRARSHVLWNFRSAQPPHSPVPIVRTSPYKSAQVRIPLLAPCALHNVPCQSSGGSRARQGDSRQSPGGTFATVWSAFASFPSLQISAKYVPKIHQCYRANAQLSPNANRSLPFPSALLHFQNRCPAFCF